MSLQSVAEEYFSKINSMASRLHADMKETKLAYEDLWGKLKYKEQQEILSESIIKPEICLRYNSSEPETIHQKYSVKMVVDDNGSYYRDEHSAPFSFKTPSQRDLTVFAKSEDEVKEKSMVFPKTVKVTTSVEVASLISKLCISGDSETKYFSCGESAIY